jgi:broad specificity phosphatase PhoE
VILKCSNLWVCCPSTTPGCSEESGRALICHGSTIATRSAAFPLDEPLDAQATELAAIVAWLRTVDRSGTSPALRARQTAAALSLNPIADPALRDCDFGRWAGRPLRDIEAEEPSSVAAWLSDADAVPHGGESIADLHRRVASWLDQHVGDKGHCVAVTHAMVIRVAILHALGAPMQSFWHIDVGPLSVTDLRSDGGRWVWRAHVMSSDPQPASDHGALISALGQKQTFRDHPEKVHLVPTAAACS